jgi:GntR family transcriptional regulator
MIPFRVTFRAGISLFEQVVYAATKAMVSGQLRPGDPFPSVRALSKELKINPNTAHKIVTHLISEGLLETRPGIGTVVAALPDSSSKERTQLLGYEIEQLVVEAKRLGIELAEVLSSVSAHWQNLSGEEPGRATTPATRPKDGGNRR